MPEPGPDYAEPAALPSSRRRERRVRPAAVGLWGGRSRLLLLVGAWVAAVLLALPLVLPVVVADETGAASPEAAVAQVLRGIADLDPVVIAAVVDPHELDDPHGTADAYAELGTHVVRLGDEVPVEVTALLDAIQAQMSGATDLDALAVLAAIDLDLDEDSLRLAGEGPSGDGDTEGAATSAVEIQALRMRISVDPGRIDDAPEGLSRAGYDVPLDRGWELDGVTVPPYLVTVRRDGRWYVSVRSTRALYLGVPQVRTDG